MKRASQMMLTVTLMSIMAFIVGCQTAPGRTQTQTFDDCVFNIMVPAGSNPSNVCSAAGSPSGAMGDLLTQNMLVDTSGSEVNSPTSTPTVTTPIEAHVNSAGGGSGVAAAATAAVMNKLGMTNTATAAPVSAAATAAANGASCADGACSVGTPTAK